MARTPNNPEEWEMKRNLIQWKFVFKLAFHQKWKIKSEFNWIRERDRDERARERESEEKRECEWAKSGCALHCHSSSMPWLLFSISLLLMSRIFSTRTYTLLFKYQLIACVHSKDRMIQPLKLFSSRRISWHLNWKHRHTWTHSLSLSLRISSSILHVPYQCLGLAIARCQCAKAPTNNLHFIDAVWSVLCSLCSYILRRKARNQRPSHNYT